MIAGIYFREEILETSLLAGIFGVIIMLIPLLTSFKFKDTSIKLFGFHVYGLLFLTFFIGGMSMCPPYFIFPFAFFGSFSFFASIFVLRKELKGNIIALLIPTVLILLIGMRVPIDIKKAMSNEIQSRDEFFEKINSQEKSPI
jgi:hypothetical protein